VDVYIDDGRAGEYQFQEVHWHNTSMWNRNAADGLPGHQDAIQGQTNYMYVKVKNRGTATATNVTVKAFHTLPGAGLVWPVDFATMSPAAGLNVASIGPNHTQEVIVGPFEWMPNINAFGHDCVLMIASAPGDPSNIDNFTLGETIEEWRLVPNDNNIGQRNVTVVPGEGRREALMAWLHQKVFWVRNSRRRRARMDVKVSLPPVMAQAGWQMRFAGVAADNSFMLAAGERRMLTIELVPGAPFTPDDVRADVERDIAVEVLANGMPLGGMIYRLDPDKKAALPPKPAGQDCNDKAAALLDCLKLGGSKVSKVCVKKVSLDIQMDNDCACD
jgi:zinc metalloprotease ZmpB